MQYQWSSFPLENNLEFRGSSESSLLCMDCKILTIDNLRKRKIRITDWCYMCKCNGEFVDHLLLHCPIASDLWSMILGYFGVYWVMPKYVVELLVCWQGRCGRHWNGHIWMVISHCLMWCIWRERNSKSFEDTESSMSNLK